MSCRECDEQPLLGVYYRWKNADVEIIACKKHWLEIRNALNLVQNNMGKKKNDNHSK